MRKKLCTTLLVLFGAGATLAVFYQGHFFAGLGAAMVSLAVTGFLHYEVWNE